MRVPPPSRRLLPIACVLAALLALAFAPQSQADVGQRIIRLCAEGKSLAGFPPSAYAKALKEMSATTEEYSECGQLIRQAKADAARAGAGGSGAATGTAPAQAVTATPTEQRAVANAARSGPESVQVGGQAIHPGVIHANVSSALSTLPTPLLSLLGFLAVCLLWCGGAVLRRRARDRRPD